MVVGFIIVHSLFLVLPTLYFLDYIGAIFTALMDALRSLGGFRALNLKNLAHQICNNDILGLIV